MPKELMDKWERINRDIRALQKEMGITPRTMEQRAADWDRKQAQRVALEQQIRSRPKWMIG
jgi:ABC-type dipeptide/oligopeptide/nickel transport system ATPase subunit